MKIGLYGMPASGKTYLLKKVDFMRVFEGSILLRSISPKFDSLEPEGRTHVRQELARILSHEDDFIMDGHYSFGNEIAFTEDDGKLYDVFLYLYVSPEILKDRISASQKNLRYGKSEMRYWLEDIPIPGTENDITITCDGIVKVGYNMEDIAVRVEENSIFVAIPEAELNDNYVILDSVKCDETNCVFNPIEFSQYQDLVTSIEQMGLEKVESEGIYANAEDHLKVLIEAFLSDFTEYEIIYM